MCGRACGRGESQAILVVILAAAAVALAMGTARGGTVTQSDWSGGGGTVGPVGAWDDAFASATGVSWRAIPGQIALAGTPRDTVVTHVIDSSSRANHIRVADLDRDGDPDVVGACLRAPGTVFWWRNDGAGVWTRFVIDAAFTGARGVAVGDLDGDGLVDVAGTGFGDEVAWWRNLGGNPPAWQKYVIVSDFTGGHRLWVADLDGDGDADLVGAAYTADDIRWWRNDGGSPLAWTEAIIDADFDGAVDVHVGDLEGDGDLDIVGAAYDGDRVDCWRNDGGDPITWTRVPVASAYNGAHEARLGDIDGDGDADVASVAYFANSVDWWENGGGDPISWTRHVIKAAYLQTASLAIGDCDGDNDLDVVAAGYESSLLAWWENVDGAGGSWTMRWIQNPYEGAWPIDMADMDLDGDLDPVCAAYFAPGHVQWWEVSRFGTSGSLESSILDLGERAGNVCGDWAASAPAGALVSLQARGSDDPAAMGDWCPVVAEPGALLPGVSGRYFQYRVLLAGPGGAVSPVVRELGFDWVPLTASVAESRRDHAGLRLVGPQPAGPGTRWTLLAPEDGLVRLGGATLRLDLFDPRGRCVARVPAVVLSDGRAEIAFPSVPSGVYWLRAAAGSSTVTARVVCVR